MMQTRVATISAVGLLTIIPILVVSNYQYFFVQNIPEQGLAILKERIGLSAAEIKSEYFELLKSIRPPFNSDLNSDFYSPEDIAHMEDVRGIFIILYMVVVLLGGVLMLTVRKSNWEKVLVQTSRYWKRAALVIVILGILGLFTWSISFELFHRILFPFNEYWLLDTQTSSLINLVSDGVFQRALMLIAAIFVGEGVLVEIARRKLKLS